MSVIKCLFCAAQAAVLIEAAEGCLCSSRQYQYRCVQHMLKLRDTEDNFKLVTTFSDYRILL